MKNLCIGISLIAIILLGAFALKDGKENEEYLRIHIRADSNDSVDQRVKYLIKDEVVLYLTPLIEKIDSKENAERILTESLTDIEKVCDRVLCEKGFTYKSKASLRVEEFPTRTYEDLTLPQGFYKALIIELGSGKGDNWWCVVYPPLCFSSTAKIKYKSLIMEGIDKIFS